jgi:hypothetical protein
MNDLLRRQRKYTLAVFFACASTVALFWDKLDGDQYVWVVGLVLGLYGAVNVGQKVGEKWAEK